MLEMCNKEKIECAEPKTIKMFKDERDPNIWLDVLDKEIEKFA